MDLNVTVNISSNALRHNLKRIRELAPKSQILAMVKSNAYGHGLLEVAQTLAANTENAPAAFGVMQIDDALTLAKAEIRQPIVLLTGFLNLEELKILTDPKIKTPFELVIHQNWQIDLLEKTALKKPVAVWLKIDTGMHRLGIDPSDAKRAYQRLAANKNILKPIKLMTHFASADEKSALGSSNTAKQFELFNSSLAGCPGLKSIANSAIILTKPSWHLDWIRPGILLYGISSLPDKTGIELGLKPVMTLKSRIIAIKNLKHGDLVGYGGTYRCQADMPVGVVAIGYGNGYPRLAEASAPVLIDGKLCPTVGRVSMDLISVDLRKVATAKIGTEVTLWGEGLPVEKIAQAAGTIPYVLACNVRGLKK